MTAAEDIVPALLEATDDRGCGSPFRERLGELISRGLGAESWTFEGYPARSAACDLPPGAVPFPGKRADKAPCIDLALDGPPGAAGRFRFRLPPGAEPPGRRTTYLLEAAIRQTAHIQALRHRIHLLSLGRKLFSWNRVNGRN